MEIIIKNTKNLLVRMRSPVQIWSAAPEQHLKSERFIFIGTQCDLWGKPDGTGHDKNKSREIPSTYFSLIPSLSERQCSNRIYVSCEASNPHGLPKVPLILTSELEPYQDMIRIPLAAQRSKSSMLCVSTSAYESKNAAI